jgi:hypothetical protein
MISKKLVHPIMLRAIVAFVGVTSFCYGKAPDKFYVLNAPMNENTAVRLFFNEELGLHPPLIFRVVDPKDPRLNTAPMLHEGRTAYISALEMLSLLQELQKIGLSWRESKEIREFGDAKAILSKNLLGITIVSSSGTAESGMGFDSEDIEKICKTLAPLEHFRN